MTSLVNQAVAEDERRSGKEPDSNSVSEENAEPKAD
jgi:hypothetical protein